jgi:hypothetical protein
MADNLGDAVVTQLLKYSSMALDADFALTRVIRNARVTPVDATALQGVRELLEFAREGERLVKDPVLTSNVVLAMRVYGDVLRSGKHLGADALGAAEKAVAAVLAASASETADAAALENARLLRAFIRMYQDEALSSCCGPIENVVFVDEAIREAGRIATA